MFITSVENQVLPTAFRPMVLVDKTFNVCELRYYNMKIVHYVPAQRLRRYRPVLIQVPACDRETERKQLLQRAAIDTTSLSSSHGRSWLSVC
jgi:hypothetical protein